MATEVGICNSALAKIGAKRIASLTEGSKNANICNEQYEKLRDDLLRAHVWNFAVTRRQLARLSEAPAFEFQYKYQLPSDWLRTISVHDNAEGAGTVAYRIEGRTLHTAAEQVYLRYVRRAEDPNEMTADFREVLATLIARELAIPLANSNTLFQLMDDRFRGRFRRARSADSVEDFPDRMPAGSWATARG
ncbi:MAG: hypothetical protein QNJ94_22300 [Alphaproteobacteria bacterium]|nr:hypothetical protein [Alphaproteobacteria bacterium]